MNDGSMNKLPEDVAIYIFLRLPVKSLTRFKCVSASWYTFITSSNFTSLHLNRTTSAKDGFILVKRSFKEHQGFKNVLSFLLVVDGEDYLGPISRDLDLPRLTTNYGSICHQLSGPCNGLIALTDSTNFVLLNPATRYYRLVPHSPFGCARGFYRSICGVGFGYESISKDYKIVRISEIYGEPPINDPSVMEWKCEVYDSSTDSWRELAYMDQQLPWPYTFPYSETFYRGSVHWYAHRNMVVILSFDISTEIFRIMQVPETCASYDEKYHSLVVLDDSLTFICYPDPMRESSPVQEIIDIWIMEEYSVSESWTKKYTIRSPPIESPLTVWKDRLLFLQDKSGLLISYDLNSNAVKEFNLHGYPGSLRLIVYKESLIPIPTGSTQVQKF